VNKIIILCFALVLALGCLGVGYAHWFDEVSVTQTIETGKVCIGFSKQLTGEPFGEFEGKDVGSISCKLISPIKGYTYYPGNPNTPIYTGIQVTMLNAYPCYQTALFADVANCGNIPIKISSLTPSMVRLDEAGNVVEVLTWILDSSNPPVKIGHFEDTEGNNIFDMMIVNLVGSQIHPGDKDTVEFDMHVLQPAKQGATYILTIEITGTQWNLVP